MKRRKIGEKNRKERELEDKGGNERTREKGSVWEAQRAEGLLRLKWRSDGTTSCNLEGALCCVVLTGSHVSTANTKHLCVTFSYLVEVMKPDHQH